jgi:hypothetical protein
MRIEAHRAASEMMPSPTLMLLRGKLACLRCDADRGRGHKRSERHLSRCNRVEPLEMVCAQVLLRMCRPGCDGDEKQGEEQGSPAQSPARKLLPHMAPARTKPITCAAAAEERGLAWLVATSRSSLSTRWPPRGPSDLLQHTLVRASSVLCVYVFQNQKDHSGILIDSGGEGEGGGENEGNGDRFCPFGTGCFVGPDCFGIYGSQHVQAADPVEQECAERGFCDAEASRRLHNHHGAR